nr:unnamed protein product [Callosobruchus analis]
MIQSRLLVCLKALQKGLAQHAFFKWKSGANHLDAACKPADIPVASEEVVVSDEVMQETPCAVKESKGQCATSKTPKNSEHQFSKSDYYNGAVYNNYCWSQTISDVDMTIKLPDKIGRRDLEVDISTSKITVKLKDGSILLSGELCQKCKANDVVWSVDDGKLNVQLEKAKKCGGIAC